MTPPFTTSRHLAQLPQFVAGGGDRPGQQARLVRRRAQRRVVGGGGFDLLGEPARSRQLAAPDLRQQRAQPERQGQAADRDLALAAGELLAAFLEAADRPRRLFAARGGAAQLGGDLFGAGGGAFGALGQEPAAGRAFGEPAAQGFHGGRGAP